MPDALGWVRAPSTLYGISGVCAREVGFEDVRSVKLPPGNLLERRFRAASGLPTILSNRGIDGLEQCVGGLRRSRGKHGSIPN